MIESHEEYRGKKPGGRSLEHNTEKKKESMNTSRRAYKGDCRVGILIFMHLSLLSVYLNFLCYVVYV